MINANSVTAKGNPGEKVRLPGQIFEVAAPDELLARAVKIYLGNQRASSARTKSRGQVKKTTAKMYRQKGTGRARHGSYSAPIFVGGGVAHGPDGRQNYKRSLPKTQARQALFGILSARAKSDLMVLTGAKSLSKTKDAHKLMEKIGEGKGSWLVVLSSAQKDVRKALRNLKTCTVRYTNQLNSYVVARHKNLLVSLEAVDEMSKLFIKK